MEALVPPDIEAALVTYLTPRLVGVDFWPASYPATYGTGGADSVATQVPNPRPTSERYMRLTRAGGNPRNLVQSDPRVLIECWAPDDVEAFELARLVYGHIWAAVPGWIAGVWVDQAQLAEPANFPDPDTSSPRYQFLAQLTTALESITLEDTP
jgi:hypothetical protein